MGETLSDIALYHEHRVKADTDGLVSERTWDDLNMDDVFLSADYTSSCVGRQYLYDVLHYNRPSAIAVHEDILHTLSSDTTLRSDIQKELKKLNHSDACSIASLLSAIIRSVPVLFIGC